MPCVHAIDPPLSIPSFEMTSSHMRVRHAMVAISLVILSSITPGSGINYIHSSPKVPQGTMPTGSRGDAEVRFREISDLGQSRAQRQANGNDSIREEKTLAVLLLMLRDGRGAR
jgi:hypothetical protein